MADYQRHSSNQPVVRVPPLSVPTTTYGVTVKVVLLVALPPGVVIEILLVTAPAGTVAVTFVSKFTTNVALLLPKVTFVAWISPFPVMTTCVPTGPLAGLKLVISGVTKNFRLLVRVPLGVVTVTNPEEPSGTFAVM